MSSKLAVETPEISAALAHEIPAPGLPRSKDERESLFEQVPWLYVFCRERLFRDDTMRISQALWPNGSPAREEKMIELGCGPGFYSCRFAQRFPQLSVVGVDRSESQLGWARSRARSFGLENCRFEKVNVLDIPYDEDHFDTLIASRLFTVLAEREQALGEMHRVLRPGGRCMLAEPRQAFRASVPLVAMWMYAWMTRFHNGYLEPHRAVTLKPYAFADLCATQPWRKYECWQSGGYQYALCEKA
ncbi:MAG: class I SAM-dependent methyltransferase [Chthoniobacterales bacterium]